jgi:hypothetical protein
VLLKHAGQPDDLRAVAQNRLEAAIEKALYPIAGAKQPLHEGIAAVAFEHLVDVSPGLARRLRSQGSAENPLARQRRGEGIAFGGDRRIKRCARDLGKRQGEIVQARRDPGSSQSRLEQRQPQRRGEEGAERHRRQNDIGHRERGARGLCRQSTAMSMTGRAMSSIGTRCPMPGHLTRDRRAGQNARTLRTDPQTRFAFTAPDR